MATSPDVLIIGAGPTGLTAAAEAIRHGLSVRVIDQNESRSIYSKALVVHSRSLEIFQDMGFAANVINSGQKFRALNIFAGDKSLALARIVFEELDWQDAIFPYWLSIPQSETERCLEHHLNELGGSVERQTELINLEKFPEHVHVTLKHQGDSVETVDVPWIVACDGARSPTRELLGLELKGRADDDVFILGDVKIDWDRPEDEGNNILSSDGIVLIVPMPETQRFRIIAHMPKLSTPDQAKVSLDLLQSLVDQRTPFAMRLSDLTWSSMFSSKHFVASGHRLGRVFLAGDAEHLHSPVGGQGLNSGIQDAYNLIWKLALIQHGKALPELLDSYTIERHKTAQNLIKRVGTATKIVTLRNPFAQKLRNRLAGVLINTDRVRNRMGRDVAMLDIGYKNSPAVAQNWSPKSIAGYGRGASAGMRAPNVIFPTEGSVPPASLFDIYRGTHYTLLLFSGITGSPAMNALLEIGSRIQAQYQAAIQPYIVTVDPPSNLHDNQHVIVDTDQSIHRSYAAWQPCLYLIRPDKYIAYRSQGIDKDHLTTYLDRFLIRNPLS